MTLVFVYTSTLPNTSSTDYQASSTLFNLNNMLTVSRPANSASGTFSLINPSGGATTSVSVANAFPVGLNTTQTTAIQVAVWSISPSGTSVDASGNLTYSSTVYLNGLLSGQTTLTQSFLSAYTINNNSVFLGGSGVSQTGQTHHGMLHQFQMYMKGLSASECLTLSNVLRTRWFTSV
jgi:hypothetical protein